ncbi:DUF4097 family beta strand repeat-containing protein [Psychrobacillus sp. FSL K6-2843]|uniref:DUF4097 family beta strand repeat-containing protein n=1 Tax=Psychrobacillus sp. FSL K6-2843 TaxID=2921549 RepID=UPI00315A3A58
MKKLSLTGIIILVLLILSACFKEEGTEDYESRELDNIRSIEIDYGSTDITLESVETDSLEVMLMLKDNGPGIRLEEKEEKLLISVRSDITRLLKINKMPKLHVKIPSEYKGDIIFKGSSGKLRGENLTLSADHLEVNGSSGGVSLDFQDFQSNLFVKATSGNIDIKLDDANPDVAWLVQSNSGNRNLSKMFIEKEKEKQETKGVLGSGKYLIELKTSSGNIRLE